MRNFILSLVFVFGMQIFIGCSFFTLPTQDTVQTQPVDTNVSIETEIPQKEFKKLDVDLVEVYSEYKNADDPNAVKPIQDQWDMDVLYDSRALLNVYEDGELKGSLLGRGADKIDESDYRRLNEHCKLEAIFKREKMFNIAGQDFQFQPDLKTDINSMFFDAFYSEKKKDCAIGLFFQDIISDEEINYYVVFHPLDQGLFKGLVHNMEFKDGKMMLLDFDEFENEVIKYLKEELTDYYTEFPLSNVRKALDIKEAKTVNIPAGGVKRVTN